MNQGVKYYIVLAVLALTINESLSAPPTDNLEALEVSDSQSDVEKNIVWVDYHCERGYHWNGSRCVHQICYPRHYWNGRRCVPREGSDSVCACVHGHFWNGKECEHGDGHNCAAGFYWNGRRCVCKGNSN